MASWTCCRMISRPQGRIGMFKSPQDVTQYFYRRHHHLRWDLRSTPECQRCPCLRAHTCGGMSLAVKAAEVDREVEGLKQVVSAETNQKALVSLGVGLYKLSQYAAAEECLLEARRGDPSDPDTFMGPLINEETAIRAENWIKSAVAEGANILYGGDREGCYLYPTIMEKVTDSMKIVCEEVFAPIVSLVEVNDFDDALERINNSPFGLQYSIFANDLSLARRAIDEFECGGVVVNDIPTVRFDLQPYGGTKQSGIGKEGPKYAIEEFTEIKSVVIF